MSLTWTRDLGIERLDHASSRGNITLGSFQHTVSYREEELRVTPLPLRRIAEDRLAIAQNSLALQQQMLAFGQNRRFLRSLQFVLHNAPFPQLRSWAWPTFALAQNFDTEMHKVQSLRLTLDAPYPVLKRYDMTRTLHNPFWCLQNAVNDLWPLLNQAIDFPLGRTTGRLGPAMKGFLHQHKAYKQILKPLIDVSSSILIRRRHTANSQRVFDSVHHHFKICSLSMISFGKTFRRQWDDILKTRRDRYRDSKAGVIWRATEDMTTKWQETMKIYHEDFLPLFARHLQIMPAAELERRSASAHSFWYSYWEKQHENTRRLEALDTHLEENRTARNKHMSRMRHLSNKSGLGRRVDAANERLKIRCVYSTALSRSMAGQYH
jgi:hypothetical protein